MTPQTARPIRPARTGGKRRRLPLFQWAILPFLLLLLLLPVACTAPNQEEPKTLRVAVVPEEEESILEKRFTPLLKRLSLRLNIPVERVQAETYDDMQRLTRERKIDLGYFGGYAFVNVRREANLVPLVMPEGDQRFTTLFLTRRDHPAQDLRQMKGAAFAFGAHLSTSGHLMPRHFLIQNGMDPESFFSRVDYTGAHDRTALSVQDGAVDLGAVNVRTVHAMIREKRLDTERIRVLWETPPYANHVWAAQPGFSAGFLSRLRMAFLDLSLAEPNDREILDALQTDGFLPSLEKDFQALDAMASRLKEAP